MIEKRITNYKKVLKTVLKDDIAPLLKESSYTTKGTSFYKIEQDIVKYIDLEYFRWNSPQSLSFWFNIYLFYGDFTKTTKIDRNTLFKEGANLFFRRIGYLWSEENHMYQISNEISPNELSKQMQSDITDNLLPFFEEMSSLDSIISYLREENKKIGTNFYSLAIAIALAKAGRKEESRQYFQESPGIKEALIKTAAFYGIDIND